MFGLSATVKWITILVIVLLIAAAGAYFIYRSDFKGGTTDRITSNAIVTEVQYLGKLELVKYHIKDVFTKEKEKKYMLSVFNTRDRVMLVIAGEAIGCIDMAKLDSTALQIHGDTLHVQLPEPELCTFRIDQANSQVIEADFSLTSFSDKYTTEFVQQAMREAEAFVRDNALEQGILDETRERARLFLKPFFMQLGFAEVVFSNAPAEGPAEPAAAPATAP